MNCDATRAKLSEFIDDRLNPTTLGEVRQHLASCSDCRREADDLTYVIKLTRAEPAIEPPMAFSTRIMAHVREDAAKPNLWQRFLGTWGAVKLTAAALVAVLGVYIHQFVGRVGPVIQVAQQEDSRGAHDTSAQLATAPRESSAIATAARKADGAAPRSEAQGFAASPPAITAPGASEPSRVLQLAPPSMRSNEPAADYELSVRLTLTPRSEKVSELARETALSRDNRETLDRARLTGVQTGQPQTVVLHVPRDGYDQLKKELSAIGVIETMGGNTSSSDGLLRIKVTLLPPTAGAK